MNATHNLPFYFEGIADQGILCFEKLNGVFYAGTAAGQILRSENSVHWAVDPDLTVTDFRIRSLKKWANGLFIGTEPQGQIWVKNFTTDSPIYEFVQTPDQAVTAMESFNGKLYVGTSPTGYIYSFDGSVWRREFRPYGSGINQMTVFQDRLYVFADTTETATVFDGVSWKTMLATAYPPEYSVLAAGLGTEGLWFGGKSGRLFVYANGLSIVTKVEDEIRDLASLGTGQMMIATKSSLFLLEQGSNA